MAKFGDYSEILKGVSRSFYLSVRLLPAGMREPIGLAYLLARASDTLADTPSVSPELKLQALFFLKERQFIDLTKIYEDSFKEFIVLPKERLLLENLAWIHGELDHLESDIKKEIDLVFSIIVDGQYGDVQRFEVEQRSIETNEELLDYCYSVAGCVGEFWTRIGFLSDSRFSNLDALHLENMGRALGIGLQLVNIIRDAPKDLAEGRVYIPGMKMLSKECIRPWVERAEEGLTQGIQYSDSLRTRCSRVAVYLPAVLGLDTLSLIKEASIREWERGGKVSRGRVYQEILSGFLRQQSFS